MIEVQLTPALPQTVQLSRKEVLVSQEKVAELAATVTNEKDKQLVSLATHVEQLEMALGQKEEVKKRIPATPRCTRTA